MNTRKFILSLLLLVTATFMGGLFAQSAEDAAKYGQLQEIQVPAAGKLGKFIKKADPNVTALKISGELNEKDWELLYSLPNVAYLDLQDIHNVATLYKYKNESGYKGEFVIQENELLLFCTESLKYLVVPRGVNVVSLSDNIKYSLDMLVSDSKIAWIKHRNAYSASSRGDIKCENMKFNAWTILPSESGYPTDTYLSHLDDQNYSWVHCKTLYLEGGSKRYNCLDIYPAEIIISSTGERILNHYIGNSKSIDLSEYNQVLGNAFRGSSIESVNTGEHITEIPTSCFAGCKKLKQVILPNVKAIRSTAFYDCRGLEKIYAPAIELVERNAFLEANIPIGFQYTYKLSANNEKIDLGIFDNTGVTTIDLTEFQYAPDIDETIWDSGKGNKYTSLRILKKNTLFLIPQGVRAHRYNTGIWEDFRIKEVGAKNTYVCRLDSVGSLKHYITDDIAQNVESLTLNGVMDETEFEIIRKCKNLKYLDMSHCFTFASVEVAKNKAKAELAFAQLVALASGWDRQQKELQHTNHEISTEQLQQAQVRDYFIQNSGIEDISMEDIDAVFGQGKVILSSECYFPDYALIGLWQLEEIKFPRKLLKLEVKNLWDKSKFYTKLRKVTFSNELKYFGKELFYEAKNLQDVNFPDSLQYIGELCFAECNLKKINLSHTKITQCDDHIYKNDSNLLVINAFYGNPIEEFHSPKNFVYRNKWYEGQSGWYNTKADEVIMYMNTLEPFCNAEVLQGIIGKIKEIHIPRGMKAAWRGYPNLIDDIDL